MQFGRPAKKPPDNFADLVKRWKRGKLRTKELTELTGLSETTLYRRLRELNITRKK